MLGMNRSEVREHYLMDEDDLVYRNCIKVFDITMSLNNQELRKEVENWNWSYTLQMLRTLDSKIHMLEKERDEYKEDAWKYRELCK